VDYFTANGYSSYHTITVSLGTYARNKVTAIQFYTWDGNFAGTGTRVWYLDNIRVLEGTPSILLLPGDANGDGRVDVGDLGILAANYGGSGKTREQGDFNGDGVVDVGDLGILAAHYGEGADRTVDFNADYSKAFGTMVSEDQTAPAQNVSTTSGCTSLGLLLLAGMAWTGIFLAVEMGRIITIIRFFEGVSHDNHKKNQLPDRFCVRCRRLCLRICPGSSGGQF
jgi:hypothetical protein